MKKLLYILTGLILIAPVTGELWRLPLMGFEFLPSDLLIPVFFGVWVVDKYQNDRKIRIGKIGKVIIVFLGILLLSYLINLYRFPLKQMIIAFSYLGRTSMYIILALMAYDLLQRDKKKVYQKVILGGFTVSMLLIVLFGFLQLKYFPSFLELGLQLYGWDPHIGRLLSTWFDPNFISGYLAFILGPTIAMGLYFRHKGNRRWFYVMSGVSFLGVIALYLTFSRSGYLAMLLTIGILAFLKSRKLLVAGVLIVLMAFTFSPRVQERTIDAWDSGKALLGLDSQKPLDPTAELRVWSWSFAREIIADHPWIGVGYSRYAYEINTRGHGLLSDHASGGSDSSLLTVWATSGVFGLISYLAVGFTATVVVLKRSWKRSDFRSYLDAGLVAGFAGTMIHSIFVNSLLFPLMMVYLWFGLGLLDEK